MKTPNGFVIYEGPSLLDGAPIIAIATGFNNKSQNEKTGAMIQTWILRTDTHPIEATRNGNDSSVCGDCPHRGIIENGQNKGRSCYVKLMFGPTAIYKGYHKGIYPHVNLKQLPELGQNRAIRVGSYGDPAAVPIEVWKLLCQKAESHTGYTHQWRNCSKEFASLVMASCDSEQDRVDAKAIGYRTFRVKTDSMAAMDKLEKVCPASNEAGKKTTCQACKACNGNAKNRKSDIVINAHGSKPIMNNYNRKFKGIAINPI